MIGERIRVVGTGLRLVYPGLRLNRRRAGKTGGAFGQPAWRLRAGANDAESGGLLEKKRRIGRRGGNSSAYKLAERALVFLMDARAFRCPVLLNVRPDRGGR